MTKYESGRLGWRALLRSGNACFIKASKLAHLRFEKKGLKCLECGTPTRYEKRGNLFCSHSCAARFNNRHRGHKSWNRSCLYCTKPLSNPAGHFCSSRCQGESRYESYIKKWLAGGITGGWPTQVSRYVRRWLLTKFGGRCVKCGWGDKNPVTGTSPINVDHIDGNSSNHRPENLRLLCPNCHSLTPTFGSLNRGRGRLSLLLQPPSSGDRAVLSEGTDTGSIPVGAAKKERRAGIVQRKDLQLVPAK